MDNIETSEMFFNVLDLSNSSDVVSSCNESKMSGLVGEPFEDLVVFKVVFNGISFVDFWVRESDSSSIVGHNVGNLVGSDSFGLNLHQFASSFRFFDLDEDESSLNVKHESIVLSSFDDGDHVLDADWELDISSDFIINLDASLLVLDNHISFTASEGNLEMVSKYRHSYLRRMERGRHSLSLWGPWLGLVA